VSFPKPYADAAARLRVPLGFLLAAAFVWLASPTGTSLGIGIPVALTGLAVRAWAAGHLKKNQTLAEDGPYAYVRNPLYLGTLTVAAGFVIAARRWELAVLFGAAFLLLYLPALELEEQHLRSLFPEYGRYAQRVPRLIPRLRAVARGRARFDAKRYTGNREYQALLAFLAVLMVLAWKAVR
jgi:protein-S-isoprenylcysteine O-methyltransferase Ste14